MANSCFTDYIVDGSKEELLNLYEEMTRISSMEKPLVSNSWGVNFLGCLVTSLGGNIEDIYCRGLFIDLMNEIDSDGIISFTTVTAWVEMAEMRHFLESQYPRLNFFYLSEESGCDYYDCNDIEGKYWKSLDKKYY